MVSKNKIFNNELSVKDAFSLAEILVTIAIVGFVASMTITNLNKKIQDIELKNAWKKAYANISNVYNKAYSENGASFGFACDANATTRTKYLAIKSGMKVVKSCEGNILGNCWPTNGAFVNNTPGCDRWWPANLNNAPSGFVTADGMYWILHGRYNGYACPYMAIDINGSKGPNKWGKDTFGFIGSFLYFQWRNILYS